MLIAYVPVGGVLKDHVVSAPEQVPEAALWLDLVQPEPGEDHLVETVVGVEIPTREEMREIEPTSRLRATSGARYMTLSVLVDLGGVSTALTPVTFILAKGRLITVRYSKPNFISKFASGARKLDCARPTAEGLLLDLLDTIIDRAADVLEDCGTDIERLSQHVFDRKAGNSGTNNSYRAILSRLGHQEGLTSSVRESLSSLSRMIAFLGVETEEVPALAREHRARLKSMTRDVVGLADYATFLANKLQFLLDGTIGMVSLEQNNIIKIFAVLSVVLMPPTLIASVYGMNFEHMPELHTAHGYPIALAAMLISAITPYLFFKWRGWL